MGGIGSGRRHYGAKDTTEDYRALDIRRFHREGLLVPGSVFGWSWSRRGKQLASLSISVASDRIVLDYKSKKRHETEWRDQHYPVYLDRTPCHLGGTRPWFRCPGLGCGRRVAKLYGGEVYVCRHCRGLAYQSQREVQYDRLARRADTIRAKLGWEPGILNGRGWLKPKGMHWKTFERLVAEHDRLVEASLRGMATKMRLLGDSIEDWI